MSRDQVQEEKLAVQRALLHFEGLHGRPVSVDLFSCLYYVHMQTVSSTS